VLSITLSSKKTSKAQTFFIKQVTSSSCDLFSTAGHILTKQSLQLHREEKNSDLEKISRLLKISDNLFLVIC